jgi:hypothetical protein
MLSPVRAGRVSDPSRIVPGMIRLVPPLPSPDAPPPDGDASGARATAYAVPWTFDRSLGPPLFTLTNVGSEVLHAISLHLLGSGTMLCRAPITMRPGDTVRIVLRHDDDLARDTVLVVRWFRPDGGEYLWRVSF